VDGLFLVPRENRNDIRASKMTVGCSHQAGSARIVQLTSGAPGPCFFLVPGTGGRIDGFVKLAPYLQIPMPVFAIEARGLDEASMPDTSVEDMA